ncbi:MAG: cupin domain-containing protein [Chloroflexi bacterium]|nr:cupin domain-containing protein [Chloroflexota bacterium]
MHYAPQPGGSLRLARATLSNSCWFLNQLITFLAVGADTEGRFALLRVIGARGTELPPHYHLGEDETLYLLEGELTVRARDQELHLGRGESVSIPRGLEHSLRHDSSEVAFLLQFSPAGFERYFHEMSEPAEYLGRPLDPAPPDQARLMATAARYGCVFTR